jgi:hypothetical protein
MPLVSAGTKDRGARLTVNGVRNDAEQSGKSNEQEESTDTVDPFVRPVSNLASRPSLSASFRGEGSVCVIYALFL